MIKKKSLAEEVAFNIRKDILTGKYLLDEKLPIEPELMKKFGVGRSTIREAIKLLSNAGFLRVQQGVGTFISSVNINEEPIDQRLKRADVQELNEVRQLLEMKIAEKAAINRSEKDIEMLKHFLAEREHFAAQNDIGRCIDADICFHTALAEASKNEILCDLYKAASVHVKNWLIDFYTDTEEFKVSQNLHEQLLKNVIAGDSQKSWATVERIIKHQY
jgi:DNA-binding FadR family transcriptional regulator